MSAGDERTVSTRLFLAVAASAVFISVLTATMINEGLLFLGGEPDRPLSGRSWRPVKRLASAR
jgi:hypothetical protein